MSFHPNEVARRARLASLVIALSFGSLAAAFFRTQVLQHEKYSLKSEENRLREVPIPAPRGLVLDRRGDVIAENVPGYSVSLLAPSVDSLRAALQRLSEVIELSTERRSAAIRRFQRAPNRPTVILTDAPFDVISVLEEHRVDFPGLIIQSSPKRHYPDGPAVSAFVGYVGEISESELASARYRGYKAGQQIGKGGLEKQYESELRGQEGSRFVEVDARGRVVREAGARQDLLPGAGPDLHTSIDLDLQRYAVSLFGDSLMGGVVAMIPTTGEVLALHSHPGYDVNRFIGGIPADYWQALRSDPRTPLYNKAIQGLYPPASTFKLTTSVIALQHGLAKLDTKMPQRCTGGMWYGNRYFRCWEKAGHGDVTLAEAIAVSCDVYFYQLGVRIGLRRLLEGGIAQGFYRKAGIDLPDELRPRWPYGEDYFNRRYGPRGWTSAVTLNLAIGQGENSQSVVNMARYYSALATDGIAATPFIAKRAAPDRQRLFTLSRDDMEGLRAAMAGVVSTGGTAASAAIQGTVLAGKTGTAQNAQDPTRDHAWFVGFAPAGNPKILVAVFLEYGEHGYYAARLASKIIARYLKETPTEMLSTDG